jgi:Major Facilitator Superfamily
MRTSARPVSPDQADDPPVEGKRPPERGETEATGANRVLILALTCAAQFMVVLDIAIVNVALPAIQLDLGLGLNALQWVVVAYGLLLGGFLLLGGRLGDLLGRRRIFLVGLTLFSAASLLAGLAQSAEVLIAARAFQGFGAALVAPSALAILAVTFTEGRERNWALGIFGAVGGSSASVGVIARTCSPTGLGGDGSSSSTSRSAPCSSCSRPGSFPPIGAPPARGGSTPSVRPP